MSTFLVLLGLLVITCSSSFIEDELLPYSKEYGHGPKSTHIQIKRSLESDGFTPFEIYSPKHFSNPQIVTHTATKNINGIWVPIRVTTAENPLETFSIQEPREVGGCRGDHRNRVSESAKNYGCRVASNAGYFNMGNGDCYGNLVSDGRIVQNTGIQNANFGIKRDGRIVVGYLHEDDVSSGFANLVAGVVWLVRNGTNYIRDSATYEDMSTQDTGNQFITIQSARTALGHDAEGRLVLVQFDGKSFIRGVNLNDVAQFLVDHGVVNAINLDGGGSATFVVNGTLVNTPSDSCGNNDYDCERRVTSLVCIHDPYTSATL